MSKGKKTGSIGRRHWVEAGLWLLAEEGLGAVTIDRLCANLSVTKGSFYWHFKDRQDFLQAMANYWASPASFLDGLSASELDDWEQVNEVARRVGSLGYGRIDKAMRVWAGTSSETAAAVENADAQILSFITKKLSNLGLTKSQAQDVAALIVSSGIGMTSIDPSPTKRRQARLESLWLTLINTLKNE